MIIRAWCGWTLVENADVYERLLNEEIFPGIAAKGVLGYRGVQLLRRSLVEIGEVEFMTLMTFDSIEHVKLFAGTDYETAYIPESARAVLARFDSKSRHYEVR